MNATATATARTTKRERYFFSDPGGESHIVEFTNTRERAIEEFVDWVSDKVAIARQEFADGDIDNGELSRTEDYYYSCTLCDSDGYEVPVELSR
jgi:hypothetical protein